MTDQDPPLLTDRFREALQFAFDTHRTQRRKGSGVPYISHLMSVAALVLEDGSDEEEAIAALLHDSIEDQPVTREQLERNFGPKVARIVAACTDATCRPKPPWEERKQAYVGHIRTAAADERRVSCADKVHNARSILADHQRIGPEVWGRFSVPREKTLWYYRALATAFRQAEGGAESWLVRELERLVGEMERLA